MEVDGEYILPPILAAALARRETVDWTEDAADATWQRRHAQVPDCCGSVCWLTGHFPELHASSLALAFKRYKNSIAVMDLFQKMTFEVIADAGDETSPFCRGRAAAIITAGGGRTDRPACPTWFPAHAGSLTPPHVLVHMTENIPVMGIEPRDYCVALEPISRLTDMQRTAAGVDGSECYVISMQSIVSDLLPARRNFVRGAMHIAMVIQGPGKGQCGLRFDMFGLMDSGSPIPKALITRLLMPTLEKDLGSIVRVMGRMEREVGRPLAYDEVALLPKLEAMAKAVSPDIVHMDTCTQLCTVQ